MRHVFYRQYFKPSSLSVASESLSASEGVWLVGAEIGLHYEKDGTLAAVFGTQFDRGVKTSVPLIGTKNDAYTIGQQAVLKLPEFSEDGREQWSSRVVQSLFSRTTLLLHSTGDNGLFRYVWETPTLDDEGHELFVTIDAENGSLLSVEDRTTRSECVIEQTTQDSAIGKPQNIDIDPRNLWATRTNDDRGGDFTHDGHKRSGITPEIQVFMGTTSAECGDSEYVVLPLETDTTSGKPIYDDPGLASGVVDIQNIGGDALFFTFKTMAAFDAWGWDGWDDSGSPAVVVVDDNSGCEDNAHFVRTDIYDWAPLDSVAICPRDDLDYSTAAAIDVVGHEWGHGVVYEGAGWLNSGNGRFYHEGFADIIAHAVEWRTQPTGAGKETADWLSGEDVDFIVRRADVDDDNPNGGYSYHKNDPATYSANWGHFEGHRLTVAFFLMADGDQGGYSNDHKNPWCATDDENDDCDVTVIDIGVTKATKILFHTLTNYLTSSSDWEDFGPQAQYAAYTLYKNCPTSWAQTEQQSVHGAFKAIGYEPLSSSVPFECWGSGP